MNMNPKIIDIKNTALK